MAQVGKAEERVGEDPRMSAYQGADATVRYTESETRPAYNTHALEPTTLTGEDVDKLVLAMTTPMPYDTVDGRDPDISALDGTGPTPEQINEVYEMLGQNNGSVDYSTAEALAILYQNGAVSKESIGEYTGMPEEQRDAMMAGAISTWLDDPSATMKDTIAANIGVESMLGTEDGVLDTLNVQSLDVLLGSTEDGHVNTFFYDSISGNTLQAMEQMLDAYHDPELMGDNALSDDAYLDACDSNAGRTMTMTWCANNTAEAIAGTDAQRLSWNEKHPGVTPEAVMQDLCDKQGWNYEDFVESVNNPNTKDKDAYRFPLVNGEWPDDIGEGDGWQYDEKTYHDAYNLILSENINGGQNAKPEEREKQAGEANSLLRTALTAGIDAFRDVLDGSKIGQQILMVCNNLVHTPPVNGTMFQEIWDMDNEDHYPEERLHKDVDLPPIKEEETAVEPTQEPPDPAPSSEDIEVIDEQIIDDGPVMTVPDLDMENPAPSVFVEQDEQEDVTPEIIEEEDTPPEDTPEESTPEPDTETPAPEPSTPLPEDSIPVEVKPEPSIPLPEESIPVEVKPEPSIPLPEESIPIETPPSEEPDHGGNDHNIDPGGWPEETPEETPAPEPSIPLPEDSVPVEVKPEPSIPLPEESMPIETPAPTAEYIPDADEFVTEVPVEGTGQEANDTGIESGGWGDEEDTAGEGGGSLSEAVEDSVQENAPVEEVPPAAPEPEPEGQDSRDDEKEGSTGVEFDF